MKFTDRNVTQVHHSLTKKHMVYLIIYIKKYLVQKKPSLDLVSHCALICQWVNAFCESLTLSAVLYCVELEVESS